MADRCDRCGGKPHTRHERDGRTLTLCQTCHATHAAALRDAGWFTYRIAKTTDARTQHTTA